MFGGALIAVCFDNGVLHGGTQNMLVLMLVVVVVLFGVHEYF